MTDSHITACKTFPSEILAPVLDAVRTNCHISDAQYAGNYTMCIYLLKMREYFRWENGFAYGSTLPHDDLTAWLTEREQLWENLASEPYREIPFGGQQHDPFDHAAVNASLNPQGYIYSSGYGNGMKPVFFLGELERHDRHDEFTLLVSGRELARDLAAPPAMSRGRTIFIRRESLRRMIWEKIEEWRWSQPDNAMKRALQYFDFDTDQHGALDAMTVMVLENVVQHEIGEIRAGELLGPDWQDMLLALGHCRAEIMLRALRDHLADAMTTLPHMLQHDSDAAIHFYMANLSGMRRELYPALLSAYEIWCITGNRKELLLVNERAQQHWENLSMRLLDIYRSRPADLQTALAREAEAGTC